MQVRGACGLNPPPPPLTPRAAAPAAACVAGRSRGQHMLPQQHSKQTATAPPLNLCRSQAPLGNASREAPLRIHAPATALSPNGNSAPPNSSPLTPRAAAPAAACVAGRSTGQHMLPQQHSKQTATAPPLNLCRSQAPLGNASREAPLRIHAPATALSPNGNSAPPNSSPLTPRAAAPAAACVAGRSTGQHMLPQQHSKQTATTPPTKPQKQKAHQYSSRRSRGVTAPHGPLPRPAPRSGLNPS